LWGCGVGGRGVWGSGVCGCVVRGSGACGCVGVRGSGGEGETERRGREEGERRGKGEIKREDTSMQEVGVSHHAQPFPLEDGGSGANEEETRILPPSRRSGMHLDRLGRRKRKRKGMAMRVVMRVIMGMIVWMIMGMIVWMIMGVVVRVIMRTREVDDGRKLGGGVHEEVLMEHHDGGWVGGVVAGEEGE
jgi:hypothetical protein